MKIQFAVSQLLTFGVLLASAASDVVFATSDANDGSTGSSMTTSVSNSAINALEKRSIGNAIIVAGLEEFAESDQTSQHLTRRSPKGKKKKCTLQAFNAGKW